MADKKTSGLKPGGAGTRQPPFRSWSKTFLSNLAATSNVTASAKAAGIKPHVAYEERRKNADFQRDWFVALCEGYEHLEMETLHRLRTGELKPPSGAKKAMRVFDNANALRLMAAHRETVARQRALRDNGNEEDILASLDAKLDRMRERWLAARNDDGNDQGA